MPYSEMYEQIKRSGLYTKTLAAFKGEYAKWFGSLTQGRELFLDPIREGLSEIHGYSEGEINKLFPLGKTFNKELFIHLTEENYEEAEIAEKMGWDRSHLARLAINLIDEEYYFIEQYKFSNNKKRKTFEDLQYYLIAQKIMRQVMDNIQRDDIVRSFAGGISSYKFSEVSKRVFKAQRFNVLQDVAKEALLRELILDINPAKNKDISIDRRCWIPLSTISQKLKQFYENNPLVQYAISKGRNLANIEMGRVAIIGVELEKFYKLGYSNTVILNKLGSSYNLQDIKDITFLIWQMDQEDTRKFLHTGVLS